VHLSNLLVRWYRSFNTLSLDREEADAFKGSFWNIADKESFPFVSLALDSKITTVVGANEAGKSHVLSALSKAFRATAATGDGNSSSYDKQDICRYCGFDHLDTNHWPQFVLEFTALNASDKARLKALSGLGNEPDRIWVHINGGSEEHFASVHSSIKNEPQKQIPKAEWVDHVGKLLPDVRIIAADKALASEVHIRQLLNMYSEGEPGIAYDPMVLQDLADSMRAMQLVAGKAPEDATITSYASMCQKLAGARIGPTKGGQLETLLFRDVLGVAKTSLTEIESKVSSNPQYVKLLVSDVQKKIDERLDLSRVWQQDPDLRLIVDFENGLFFFRLTDRTGTKYSFDERSSGLKFFLSYYIQALAHERASDESGMVILMDEPDGYLSAMGQRNLLHVFENLVDDRRTKTHVQLIYTTHSPFLINKNYPHRVRLVRKGDGAEGTQVVDRSAYRRFEPIRTALGIDYADTLFVGSQNVVVEGPSDQRLLTAGVQRFGRESAIDSLLDLNRVVFVTAGGAPRMRNIIQRSIGGTDDNLPVVVALFDGDAEGAAAYQDILNSSILDKDYLIALDQVGAKNPHVTTPAVLEDLIPAKLTAAATSLYFKRRWNEVVPEAEILGVLEIATSGTTMADRLKKIWQDRRLSARGIEQDVFRASVIEELVELLFFDNFGEAADLALLKENLSKVYSQLTTRLARASAAQSRQTAKKRITYYVREFKRSYAGP
jgi:predicted ATP-dependent endonuclease of OLD family